MNGEQTLLEYEVQVKTIVEDLRIRIKKIYDIYTTDEKLKQYELPSYNDLRKNVDLRYKTLDKLIKSLDDINSVKLRITIVSQNLNDIRTVQITSISNYTLVGNFRNSMKKYCDELSGYKFDLSDLQKNIGNKIKMINSMFYIE